MQRCPYISMERGNETFTCYTCISRVCVMGEEGYDLLSYAHVNTPIILNTFFIALVNISRMAMMKQNNVTHHDIYIYFIVSN